MQELRKKQGLAAGRYGSVEVVDALQYLEAVEAAPRGEIVVVYIYDDEVCSLAPSFPNGWVT